MRYPDLTPLLAGAAFFVISIVSLNVQASPPTLNETILRMDSTSPALASARLKLAAARAAYTSCRALPNPVAFAEGQTLKSSGVRETEQTVGVQQPLGFLWSRASTLAARKLAYEAELASYEEARRDLIARTILTVARYRDLEQQSMLLDTVLYTTRQAQAAMNARQREGDVSEYDTKRLHAELIQLQLRRIQLTAEQNRAAAEFVGETGLTAQVLEELTLPTLPEIPIEEEMELKQYAAEHRPGLRAKSQWAAAGRSAYSAAKLKQLPEFSVGAGRKTADPDFSGWLWQVEIELPLWGLRRSERTLARVEMDQAEIEYQAALKQVEQEVRAAYARWLHLRSGGSATESFSQQDALLSIRRGIALQAGGEFSSAELVDALRSSLDALAAHLDLQTALLAANLELRRVTGLPIPE
jgi:outer membrane protein TolC